MIYTSDKFLHNCFQFLINLHFQIASTTKKFNDFSKFTIKYQKCRRQIPKKCCVICVICQDTPGQYCRYWKIVSKNIMSNPRKIFNLLRLVSGVQRACVSWLCQLWGGGAHWGDPGERAQDEESVRDGGHDGARQQQQQQARQRQQGPDQLLKRGPGQISRGGCGRETSWWLVT